MSLYFLRGGDKHLPCRAYWQRVRVIASAEELITPGNGHVVGYAFAHTPDGCALAKRAFSG